MNRLQNHRRLLILCVTMATVVRIAVGAEPEGGRAMPHDLPRLIVSALHEGQFQILSIDPGNSQKEVLVTDPRGAFGPALSPDGRALAFVSEGLGGQIRVATIEMGAAVEVADTGVRGHSPAWSPDGKRIVFSRAALDNLYIMDRDGENVANLTKSKSRGTWIADGAWSPDGKQIAFVSGKGDKPFRLFTIGPDGKGKRELSPIDLGGFVFPDWSPDSKRIVLSMHSAADDSNHWRFWISKAAR
jgi:Tol biopolymer transport system component